MESIRPGDLVHVRWSSDVVELGVVRSHSPLGGYEVELIDRDGGSMYFWRDDLEVV